MERKRGRERKRREGGIGEREGMTGRLPRRENYVFNTNLGINSPIQ